MTLQNQRQPMPAAVKVESIRRMEAKIKTAIDRVWGAA
jgi:hypothetical protein